MAVQQLQHGAGQGISGLFKAHRNIVMCAWWIRRARYWTCTIDYAADEQYSGGEQQGAITGADQLVASLPFGDSQLWL